MTTDIQVTVSGTLEFSAEQRQLIRDTFANGASDQEFAALLEVARARRLNPFLRQIHFVSRWDSQKGRAVWATQVSIDGLRAIAQRTGLYDGQDEPEFVENPDGSLRLCRVRVYRKDWQRPAVGVAFWEEYVQTSRDKQSGKDRPTPMWRKMPHVMLAKVSEAIALRKAFPEDMSGLYTGDEMGQAENDVDASSTPATSSRKRAPIVAESTVVAPAALPAPSAPVDVPPPVADTRPAETTTAVAEPPPPQSAELTSFLARVEEIELPGESVAVWLKFRSTVAELSATEQVTAWKTLRAKTEAVGRMRNADAWLRKAIQEEDIRAGRVTPATAPANTTTTAPTTTAPAPPTPAVDTFAADDWRATPESREAHVETLAGYDEVMACARAEWGVVGLAPLLKRRLMVVAMMGEDAANNEVNVAMRKAREAAQRGPHDDGPTSGGSAAGGAAGGAARATGNGAAAKGGAHASPHAQLSAFAEHIAAKPRVRDPQDVKAHTQSLSEVAMAFLKRREDFIAAGIADAALDALRDELRSRGCNDADALLAGVIANKGARRRTPNTTEHRAADRMAA